MPAINAKGLRKSFGRTPALAGLDLRVEHGRIVGLIGPNGAGKTTALNAIVGLIPCEGELEVLGRDPWQAREELMREVSFIADVAILPRWMRVRQALDYAEAVHPRFDRARAERFLERTNVNRDSRIRELSKGMVTQVHLALVMAIDARLLVLDEPTLGLDPLFRKRFYDALLNDYVDGDRTVVVATHQLEELQHVLTDLVFVDRGRVVLECSVEDIDPRFTEVLVRRDRLAEARALGPVHERQALGRPVLLFDGVARDRLEPLGEVRTPSIPDLFLAVLENSAESTL